MSSTRHRRTLKLSREFASRLASLPADTKLHAVVLLYTSAGRSASQRRAPDQRQAAIDALRDVSRPVLVDVDQILAKWGGRRLDDEVSPLGTVAVEATPAGIKVLADLKDVKAVLEDQNISLHS